MADDQPTATSFAEIGKIPILRKKIDQIHLDNPTTLNISQTLKKRMGVIDLIPCNFEMDLASTLETMKLSAFKPKIFYQDPIKRFILDQDSYGLSPSKEFLRVYLTDSTTVQETLTNSYTKNILDDTLNSLSSSRLGQLFYSMFKAGSSGIPLGHAHKDSEDPKNPSTVTAFAKGYDPKGNLNTIANVLTHGTRISFPKIWVGADYNPSLTCNVKLVSPYGHPDAIARFIIRPLGLLMLLLAPKTRKGLVTMRPNFIALKAYGMSNLRICSPSVIEIRRGGDDNSYNQYKQPLSVDIALTFDSVSEGFASFYNEDNPEEGIFSMAESNDYDPGGILTKSFEKEFETEPNALFSTMKSLANSFRPFDYEETPAATTTTSSTRSGTASLASSLASTSNVSSGKEEVSTFNESSFIMPNDGSDVLTNILLPVTVNSVSDLSLNVSTSDPTISIDIMTISNDAVNITRIDPNNFESDDLISNLSSDSNSHEITFNNGTFQDSFSARVRSIRSDGLPGIWTENTYIQLDSNENYIVEIIPTKLINTDYLRWIVEDSQGTIYGPYTYGAVLEYGDYTLQILNGDEEIVYEEEITVSSSNTYHEAIFETYESSLTVNCNIPDGWNSDNLEFFLISDSDETIFESKNGVFEDLIVGYYSLMVKYQNYDVLYSDSVYDSILVTEDSNIINIVINDNYKITSISVSV